MTSSRHYTGRVIGINDLSPDTRKLTVEIDNKQRLPFSAGQYVHLGVEGFEERPFSIASPPHEPLLEFHIKSTGRGLSAHIIDALKPGSPIALKGPLGSSQWRPEALRPLLAVAGGLGIAPLKSIIETCLHDRSHPPVHLYWGARARPQLYLDDYFRALTKKYPRFSYIPVLSEEKDDPDSGPQYRTGFTGHAVAEDFETLAGLSIYMAGPGPMIEATLPLLLHKGAEEDYIFSDGFGV
jgi:CDP-4-dehydro-6-deoxyglucose reductase/ferredoxin-NAD(P)+ reductase (naphthalene dioxygenase ferredoxin-specific)